jgi:hypothetical protein
MSRQKDSRDEASHHDRDNFSWSIFRAKQPKIFSDDGELLTLHNWKEEKFAGVRQCLSESEWGQFVNLSLQKDQMEKEEGSDNGTCS